MVGGKEGGRSEMELLNWSHHRCVRDSLIFVVRPSFSTSDWTSPLVTGETVENKKFF